MDETLVQDQIDDIEEEEKDYLRKIYNVFYIQMEIITCWENMKYR